MVSAGLGSDIAFGPNAESEQTARRHPRLKRPGVKGRMPLVTTARLVDLSLGGAGVVTEAPLSPARSYRLVFEDGRGRIELLGRVVWNRNQTEAAESGRPAFRVGVAFDDGSIDSLSELLDFIQRHFTARHEADDETGTLQTGSEDWTATRTSTRFRLHDVPSLRIQVDQGYGIHNLSLSGMLIETRVALSPGQRVSLVLELSDGEVRTVGRVVNTTRRKVGGLSVVRAGIEFLEMAGDQRSQLYTFLNRHLN